jgi:hypothetical protein
MQAAVVPVARKKTHRPFRPKQSHGTNRTPSQWDRVYQKAASVAQSNAGWDITGLNAQELMMVQDTLSRGLMAGWSEKSFATALKPIIGVGPRFEKAVDSYRQRLLASGYSNRDASIHTDTYRNSLLRYRAKMVAEYELRTSLGQAQRDYWRDRVTEGQLSPNAKRVFRLGPTCKNHCAVCRGLNGHESSVLDDTNAPPMHPHCCCYEVIVNYGKVIKAWLPDAQIEAVKDLHLVKFAPVHTQETKKSQNGTVLDPEDFKYAGRLENA